MSGAKGGDTIGRFGARLGSESYAAIDAGATACFKTALPAGSTRALTLTAYPGSVLGDVYSGSLSLVALAECSQSTPSQRSARPIRPVKPGPSTPVPTRAPVPDGREPLPARTPGTPTPGEAIRPPTVPVRPVPG
jgi:hypothetical protein